MTKRPWPLLIAIPVVGLLVAGLLGFLLIPALFAAAARGARDRLESDYGISLDWDHAEASLWSLAWSGDLLLDVRGFRLGGPFFSDFGLGGFDLSLGRIRLDLPMGPLVERTLTLRSLDFEDAVLSTPLPPPRTAALPETGSPTTPPVEPAGKVLGRLGDLLADTLGSLPFDVVVDRLAFTRFQLTLLPGMEDSGTNLRRVAMEGGVALSANVERVARRLAVQLATDADFALRLRDDGPGVVPGAAPQQPDPSPPVPEENLLSFALPEAKVGARLEWHPVDMRDQLSGEAAGAQAALDIEPLDLSVNGLLLHGQGQLLGPLELRLKVQRPSASPGTAAEGVSPGGKCRLNVKGMASGSSSDQDSEGPAAIVTMSACGFEVRLSSGPGPASSGTSATLGGAVMGAHGRLDGPWSAAISAQGSARPLALPRLHVGATIQRGEETLFRFGLAPGSSSPSGAQRVALAGDVLVRPHGLVAWLESLPRPTVRKSGSASPVQTDVPPALTAFAQALRGQVVLAGVEIQGVRDWVVDAVSSGAPGSVPAARPQVALWIDVEREASDHAAQKKGDSPATRAAAMYEDLGAAVKSALGDAVKQRSDVLAGGGLRLPVLAAPSLRLAFLGSLEDLRLEAKVRALAGGLQPAMTSLRAPVGKKVTAPSLSLGALAAEARILWTLWPKGVRPADPRARSSSPQGQMPGGRQARGDGAPRLLAGLPADVPGIVSSFAARTPLADWSERPLRAWDLSGGIALRKLTLDGVTAPGSIEDLAAVFDVAIGEDGALATRKLFAAVSLLPSSASLPAKDRHFTRTAPRLRASLQTDVDLSRDLAAGSVGGRLEITADPGATASLGLANPSPGAQAAKAESSTAGAEVHHPEVSISPARVAMSGKISLPFRIVGQRQNGVLERLVLDSKPVFSRVALSVHGHGRALEIEGLDGEVPVQEQVAVRLNSNADGLTPVYLEWQPLLDENPFRRGGTVLGGPYSQARNLVVRRIVAGGHELGPLAATLAINQNQLLFDRVDGEILEGAIAGQCFVNIAPGRLLVDFNGRVSALDGARLLGIQGLARRDSEVSGRAALSYAVESSLVSGRVDVGRIPPRLLDQLLIKLDPSGSDSSIGGARLALGVAAPGKLAVQMAEGYATLEIEIVTAAGSSSIVRIPSLPLTRFLEDRTVPLRRSMDWARPPSEAKP